MSRREAFDFLCGLLSLEESSGQSARLRDTARSGAIHWPDIVALASRQWVSAAMRHRLERKLVLPEVPADVADYFAGITTLNRQRNARLYAQAVELSKIFNTIGVTPVFMKGAAHLFSPVYPDVAMRMMLDLDVLVPAKQMPICVAALRAQGYTELIENGFPAHHHYPPLGRRGAESSVELHAEPLDTPYQRFLPGAELSEHAAQLSVDGARLAVPAVWCRLIHAIVHAQFTDHAWAYGHLPLRDLLDTALLSRRESVDWGTILRRFETRGEKTVAAFHLVAAERLLGGGGPQAGLDDALARLLYRRARFQAAHPRLQQWIEALLRPWLLLRRALSHPLLRRRLWRSMADRGWYARQWRMLREGGS